MAARPFYLAGAKQMAGRMEAIAAAAGAPGSALAGALFREAERIMGEAKLEVPVDTGTLRSTGSVDSPKIEGQSIKVGLGFGGPAAPYALVQHERLDYRHVVGKAKYLEHPLVRAIPRFTAAVGAGTRLMLKLGTARSTRVG